MYHYTMYGLPNVYLVNGYTEHDTPYGKGVSIEDIKGLHKTIGLELVGKAEPLSPEEFRFLRVQLDFSQKRLAELIESKEITLRKWESGENKINGAADRMLRLLFQEWATGDGQIRETIERLAQLDRDASKEAIDDLSYGLEPLTDQPQGE